MTRPPANLPAQKAASMKNLFWLIPLALVVIIIAGILALPGFVASGYHRATIEKLASSLTGRTVHINGRLSLALLPHPQFIAGNVTIISPNQETITAASLTLDLAAGPLLHGEISARSITLQSPHIVLPWPLPGGASAIEPPLWLTTLHAQINNGEISLGAAEFTNVSADIFTGGKGTFSVSGNGNLDGAPIILSLSLAPVSAVGTAPLTLDIQTSNAAKLEAHISGTFDASSTLIGNVRFGAASLSGLDPSLSQPLAGTAAISADPQQILLSSLSIAQGNAKMAGTATFILPHPALSLLLTAENLTIPADILRAPGTFSTLPTHLSLDATDTTIATTPMITLAHLQTSMDFNAGAIRIPDLAVSLHGATFSLSGKIDATGNLQADALFTSTDLNSLDGDATLPSAWTEANLKAALSGDADHLTLSRLNGSFGPARVTGSAVLEHRNSLNGQLHFDQLDLSLFSGLLHDRPGGAAPALAGDFEISADRASFEKIKLTHLLADARLSNALIVRRLSAAVYGGIANASFTLSASQGKTVSAQITSARAILAIPSAAPIAALLPPAWRPPAALTKAPLSLSFLAAGPANALATSASLSLGQISITASPVIDLASQSATGAFTLRHPSAISALKAFGLNAGLAWPGAGSIALRADMRLSATQMGFSDFVLSMGDFTGNGQLVYGDHQLNGQIDADTLALPPLPKKITPPWAYLANIQGKIGILANRVSIGGNPVLGPTNASITLAPGRFDFELLQAAMANGTIKGDLSATLPSTPPPQPGQTAALAPPPVIIAKFALTGADTAAFNLPIDFPLALPGGSLDVAADLTAAGYAPAAWLATLSGNASLAAQAGSLDGFNLPALQTALTAPRNRAAQLRGATLSGTTPFSRLDITTNIASGIMTLAGASLQSPNGTAIATGDIDLPDSGITMTLTLLPAVPTPPATTLTLDGGWSAPRKIPGLRAALNWKPAPK